MTKKSALIILDGWGHGPDPKVSALAQAKTPFVDSLYHQYPNAELVTFGLQVGLPEGQMGNSEVGHLNIGAGRIVYQELARINKEIQQGTLRKNPVLVQGINHCQNTTKRFHIMGLLSDGGVHSHIGHILALCDILKDYNVEVFIHAFLDGRDTDPHGGKQYIADLLNHITGTNATLATVVGRYYAMDRDHRWERIKISYDLLVKGHGEKTEDIIKTLGEKYDEGVTDEFMSAILVNNKGAIKVGDTVLFANFRTDRPRELTTVLTQEDMPDLGMYTLPLYFMTMTAYDDTYKDVHVLFTKDNIVNTLGETIAQKGLTQVRIAETEKYPHVTFFFSGGREEPFPHEDRILVDSPKVATYDLQPQMSAEEVTQKLIDKVNGDTPDLVVLNYANTDMVGHTGVFSAAVKAAETVDDCLSQLVDVLLAHDYKIIIIADHGNSDTMINPDGTPHTAHTTNPVPVFLLTKEKQDYCLSDGKLADIAPTILYLMGIDIPVEMDGRVLI